jgi:hypothetical protein
MIAATVTEAPLAQEPVTPDPFIDGLIEPRASTQGLAAAPCLVASQAIVETTPDAAQNLHALQAPTCPTGISPDNGDVRLAVHAHPRSAGLAR